MERYSNHDPNDNSTNNDNRNALTHPSTSRNTTHYSSSVAPSAAADSAHPVLATIDLKTSRRRAPGLAHQPPGHIVYSVNQQSAYEAQNNFASTAAAAAAATTTTTNSTIQGLAHMTSAGRPSVQGMSRVRNRRRYRLVVLQHPERARMCGFGDKDRRPLSPSLIVKLLVTDEDTGEQISPWDVNTSLFFLAADLCHPDDLILAPRNLLVHQHAASVPISMLTPTQPPHHVHQQQQQSQLHPSSQHPHQHQTVPNPPPPPSAYSPSLSVARQSAASSSAAAAAESSDPTHPHAYGSSSTSGAGAPELTTVTMEHYTRNLVGAAVTSANVLRDETDEYCIFFVLQDLSVRTEGVYRIRLVFTDLAHFDSKDTNEGVSEALAECYTEPFTVYSPRRFPGMLEPTELSKKLAAQGIKIAVRSDKKKRQRRPHEGGSGSGGGGGPGPGGAGEEDPDEEAVYDA